MPPPAVPRHRPDQPHGRSTPAPKTEQRKAKGQSRRRTPRRPPWPFLLPSAADQRHRLPHAPPIFQPCRLPIRATTCRRTGKQTAPPAADQRRRPPPRRRQRMNQRTPPALFPPCTCTACRLPADSPPAPRRPLPPADRRRGQILHLTGLRIGSRSIG